MKLIIILTILSSFDYLLFSNDCLELDIFKIQLQTAEKYLNKEYSDSLEKKNKAIYFLEGITGIYTDESISWGYKSEINEKDVANWKKWYLKNQDSLCTEKYKEIINQVYKEINPDVDEIIRKEREKKKKE